MHSHAAHGNEVICGFRQRHWLPPARPRASAGALRFGALRSGVDAPHAAIGEPTALVLGWMSEFTASMLDVPGSHPRLSLKGKSHTDSPYPQTPVSDFRGIFSRKR